MTAITSIGAVRFERSAGKTKRTSSAPWLYVAKREWDEDQMTRSQRDYLRSATKLKRGSCLLGPARRDEFRLDISKHHTCDSKPSLSQLGLAEDIHAIQKTIQKLSSLQMRFSLADGTLE